MISQSKITPHFENIFKILTKIIFHEDPKISQEVNTFFESKIYLIQTNKVAEVLGVFINADYYIPIVIHHIHELDISATKTLTSYLVN